MQPGTNGGNDSAPGIQDCKCSNFAGIIEINDDRADRMSGKGRRSFSGGDGRFRRKTGWSCRGRGFFGTEILRMKNFPLNLQPVILTFQARRPEPPLLAKIRLSAIIPPPTRLRTRRRPCQRRLLRTNGQRRSEVSGRREGRMAVKHYETRGDPLLELQGKTA